MSSEQQRMTIKLELEVEETNLILEALGALPFVRVYQVISRIQEQARAQVQAAEKPEGEEEQSG
jgi:hypothetical protein